MQQQTLSTKGAGTMKHKKAVAALAIALFVATFASAQQVKEYSDPRNGYRGFAVATYEGTLPTGTTAQQLAQFAKDNPIDVQEQARVMQKSLREGGFGGVSVRHLRPCTKLSKEENFLLWKAIEEYDYNDNEGYGVQIFPNFSLPATVIQLRVVVTNSRRKEYLLLWGDYYVLQ